MQRPGIEPGPPAWQARFYHWTNVARNFWVPNWRIYIKLSSCFAYELAQLVSPSRTPNNLQLSIVYKFIFTTIKFCLNPSLSIFGEKWAPPVIFEILQTVALKIEPLVLERAHFKSFLAYREWIYKSQFTSDTWIIWDNCRWESAAYYFLFAWHFQRYLFCILWHTGRVLSLFP